MTAVCLAVVAAGIGIAVSRGSNAGSRSAPPSGRPQKPRPAPPTLRPPGPIPGYLLIADRGNNRMLLVDSARHVYWRYPGGGRLAMRFVFDDDTFFGPDRREVISNQEDQNTIQIITFPGKRVVWRYGHVDVKSGAPGFLNTPDDAYLLRDHLVSVADAYNCRVLFISQAHRIVRQYGTTGVCRHDPPRFLGAVNGATPLPDGGTLVSEISGSWIDDIGPTGRLRWAVRAPVSYPSDPQLLGPDRILLADYAKPGGAVIITRTGRVVWRYGPTSGPGELDHPSLATPIAPGLIAINDDFRDRVVIVSRRSGRIVWQYGHTDQPGRGPGYLDTPDGLDLLPTGAAQTIPAIRRLLLPRGSAAPLRGRRAAVLRIDVPLDLPAPVEREVAVAAGHSVVIAGGLDSSGSSTSGVFRLDPATGRLTSLGSLPAPFHDAAGAVLGGNLYVFGGGATDSSPAVQRFDLATGRSAAVGRLPTALSDLAAAQTPSGVYLVGGFDGRRPRREVYRTTTGRSFVKVALLPAGTRYPAVAAAGRWVVIAGGITASGTSRLVYELDTATSKLRLVGRLPQPVAHAEAFTLGSRVYVAGGIGPSGGVVDAVVAIDPASGSIRAVDGSLPVRDAPTVPSSGAWLVVGGGNAGGTTRAIHRVALR